MVTWDVLDAECDNETQQATSACSLVSLYEVIKLAYFESNEQVDVIPEVSGSVAYNYINVIINSSLFVFKDGGSKLFFQLSTKHEIDQIIWLPGGEFFLIADRSGTLHCVHVFSKRILFKKELGLCTDADDSGKLFVAGKSFALNDDTAFVILITRHGQIVRLGNVDLDGLLEGLEKRDTAFLLFLQSQLTFSVNNISNNLEVLCADCESLNGSDRIKVWLGTEEGIYCWASFDIFTSCPVGFQLCDLEKCEKIASLHKGRYIAVVNNSQSLSIVCTVTGVVITGIPNLGAETDIIDMLEVSSDASSSQLLVLLKITKENGTQYRLNIVNIPGFSSSYYVAVSEDSSLLHLGEKADSIAFIEPIYGDNECITGLKLKSIVDGVPEARLNKFNEAEEFCGFFELNTEDIFKAKAKYQCELISPFKSFPASTSQLEPFSVAKSFEELLLTLGRINDDEFVTRICVEASLFDLTTTKQLLKYGKGRLSTAAQVGGGDYLKPLMQRISETLYSLMTFENIFPRSDINHWFVFSRGNMFNEFMEHLQRGNLDTAAVIWHRHQFEFSDTSDDLVVAQILKAVPVDSPSNKLCAWLPKNLLKDLMHSCPSAMEVISLWADERIRFLEVFEKDLWPKNGLAFATMVIKAMDDIASDFFTGGDIDIQMAVNIAQGRAHSPESHIYHLRQTALALHDLNLLDEKFFVKIKFDQYCQENKANVVTALLDWLVSGKEVSPLMEIFLRKFMLSKKLDCDQTLAEYVSSTLSASNHVWWRLQEAPWEDKLYAVIHLIVDAEIKAHCIIECIQMASVPWSDGTVALCASGKALNTTLTPMIAMQEKMARLKIIFRRHNLHFVKFEDERNADFLLRSISKRDGNGILDDLLKVSTAFKSLRKNDAYFYRLYHFISTENFNEAALLLEAVEGNILTEVCRKFISYVITCLNIRPLRNECREKQKIFTRGFLALERFVRQHTEDFWPNFLSAARKLNVIQAKFDLYPTLNDLENNEICTRLVRNYINEINLCQESNIDVTKSNATTRLPLSNSTKLSHCVTKTVGTVVSTNEPDEPQFWCNVRKVLYLSSLLGVPTEEVYIILTEHASGNGFFDEALHLCGLLTKETRNTNMAAVIYGIIRMILKDSIRAKKSLPFKDIFRMLYELTSAALTTVPADEIFPLSELNLWCQIGSMLYKQCHVKGIYSMANLANTFSDDCYTSWKFSPLFADPGLPVDEIFVTQFLKALLSCCLLDYENNDFVSNNDTIRGLEMDSYTETNLLKLEQHLRERNQDLMLLVVSQNFLSVSVLMMGEKNKQLPVKMDAVNANKICTLLMKIISSESKDLAYAISFLTLLPIKQSLKVINDVIRKVGYDFSRLKLISKVGCDICKLFKLLDVFKQFEIFSKNALWGEKLEGFDISYKSFCSQRESSQIDTLEKIVTHPNFSFNLLDEFCNAFSIDKEEAHILYLKSCIQAYDAGSIYDTKLGIDAIALPTDLCHKINKNVSRIRNTNSFNAILYEQLNLLCSYNYEMLDIVLTHLMQLDVDSDMSLSIARAKNILEFLKVYKRSNSPSKFEIEEWCQNHTESTELPSIAKIRLPFHELCSKENEIRSKIMNHEICISNVDKWITVADALKCNKDQIYFISTQNTVNKLFSDRENDNNNWQLLSYNSSFLIDIQKMISKISNPELATACANWVVKTLPRGVDKVDAAKRCSMLANQWLAVSSQPRVNDFCIKFKAKYETLAIENALRRFGLADSEFLAKINEPIDLVSALFDHCSLSSLVCLSADSVPDIDGCVTEICNIVGINKFQIQSNLLEKWLPAGVASTEDPEETISNFQLAFGPSVTKDADGSQDPSLSKIIYLLRCCPQKEAVSYLLDLALSEDSSVGGRLSALRCLLAVADPTISQQQSGKSSQDLRLLLQGLTYVSRLESLGRAMSLSLFEELDKDALVESLWRSHQHVPVAVILIVDICRDFKVTTASLWGAVIAQLKSFVEFGKLETDVLERVLLYTRTLPHLWCLPELVRAWEIVIQAPFARATSPVEADALRRCVHSTNLLLRQCPVSVSSSFSAEIRLFCETLSLPVLAVSITVTDLGADTDVKSLLDSFDIGTVKRNYDDVKLSLYIPEAAEIALEDWIDRNS